MLLRCVYYTSSQNLPMELVSVTQLLLIVGLIIPPFLVSSSLNSISMLVFSEPPNNLLILSLLSLCHSLGT